MLLYQNIATAAKKEKKVNHRDNIGKKEKGKGIGGILLEPAMGNENGLCVYKTKRKSIKSKYLLVCRDGHCHQHVDDGQ